MSSWGLSDFKIKADPRGYWPLPTPDADGLNHYRATVRFDSEVEYKNLANNLFIGTFKRARSSRAFTAKLEAGTGAQVLTVPIMSGEPQSFSLAYLVSYTPITHGGISRFEAELDFVILDLNYTP